MPKKLNDRVATLSMNNFHKAIVVKINELVELLEFHDQLLRRIDTKGTKFQNYISLPDDIDDAFKVINIIRDGEDEINLEIKKLMPDLKIKITQYESI